MPYFWCEGSFQTVVKAYYRLDPVFYIYIDWFLHSITQIFPADQFKIYEVNKSKNNELYLTLSNTFCQLVIV